MAPQFTHWSIQYWYKKKAYTVYCKENNTDRLMGGAVLALRLKPLGVSPSYSQFHGFQHRLWSSKETHWLRDRSHFQPAVMNWYWNSPVSKNNEVKTSIRFSSSRWGTTASDCQLLSHICTLVCFLWLMSRAHTDSSSLHFIPYLIRIYSSSKYAYVQ